MSSNLAELERALGRALVQEALHGVQHKPDFLSAIAGHVHKHNAEEDQELLKGLDEHEMRIDPDEKRVWTFAEYRANYAARYKLKDIVDYWRVLCVPFKIVGKHGKEARSKSRMRSLARRSTASIRIRSTSRRRARSRRRLATQRLARAHGGTASPDGTDEEVIETEEPEGEFVAVPAPPGLEAAAAVAAARGRETELWALYARLSLEQAGRQRVLDKLKQSDEGVSNISGSSESIASETSTPEAHKPMGAPPVRRNALALHSQLLEEHAMMQTTIGNIVKELGGPMAVATTLGLWPPPEVTGAVDASEQRVDPDLKMTWTFIDYYVGHLHAYKPVDIYDYWNAVCTPCADDSETARAASSGCMARSASQGQPSQGEPDGESACKEPDTPAPPLRGRAPTPPPSRCSAPRESASPCASNSEESDRENNPNLCNSPKRQSHCSKDGSALSPLDGHEGNNPQQVSRLV
mmetsp:Transcript_149067/g.285646  ORF Transcript_149067/g.285646 Transcript_149067/m.285646 type:complete len:466 (-) Transcript_149067:123-1520(-)